MSDRVYPILGRQRFVPGDKVWYRAGKARVKGTVIDVNFGEDFQGKYWAVPVKLKGSIFIHIVHEDALVRR